jgi:hypothetical protein
MRPKRHTDNNPAEVFINIAIHGLFFMELNLSTNNLEIYAPKVDGHLFAGGLRGNLILLSGLLDWHDTGLIGKSPTWPKKNDGSDDKSKIPLDLPATIVQFMRSETGVGDLIQDLGQLAGKVILPWPLKFYSLRCDSIQTTFPCKPSPVGDNILKHCKKGGANTYLGSSACLTYKLANPFPPLLPFPWAFTIHLHLQPCLPHDLTAVNKDLANVAYVFPSPTDPKKPFKLEFDDSKPIPATTIGLGRCSPPPGIVPEDEHALCEEQNQICPDELKLKELKLKGISGPGDNVNPANCPLFFVGP